MCERIEQQKQLKKKKKQSISLKTLTVQINTVKGIFTLIAYYLLNYPYTQQRGKNK